MVSEICPGCLCYCCAAYFIYFHYSFVDESLKSVQDRKILGDGFWTYLTFTMQMVLLMVTGMTLASVPFINRGLQSVAKLVDTPQKAYTMTFLISAIAYYINWGLAVVVGAIIAKEVAKKNPNAHFPLLVAAAYAPTALYSAGLSSSISTDNCHKGSFSYRYDWNYSYLTNNL
ncbi:TIGR00366 family protein [Bacillus sp. OR9]|nr:TIGR00366 family protein [Bacillus sp. OR9]